MPSKKQDRQDDRDALGLSHRRRPFHRRTRSEPCRGGKAGGQPKSLGTTTAECAWSIRMIRLHHFREMMWVQELVVGDVGSYPDRGAWRGSEEGARRSSQTETPKWATNSPATATARM